MDIDSRGNVEKIAETAGKTWLLILYCFKEIDLGSSSV
jgi:hypothetical protein